MTNLSVEVPKGNTRNKKQKRQKPQPRQKFIAFTVLFIFIVVGDLLAMTYYPNMRLILKPAIVGSLMGWYASVVKYQSYPFLIALIFAMLGDLFLFFEGDLFFKIGIFAFSVMQVLYISVFRHYYRKPEGVKLYFSAIIPVISVAFIVLFKDKLGDYVWMVMIYALLISIMAYYAINKTQRYKGARDFVIGGFAFMLSDLLLAYNKFVEPKDVLPYIVMITYAIAQYFIVKGMIDDSRKVPPPVVNTKPQKKS